MKRNLISIKNLAIEEIQHLFDLTDKIKESKTDFESALSGKTLGMIFQKPSNRTRVSFEVGMTQLGGHAIYLGPETIKLGVREKTSDIAKTLSRYLDVIVARTHSHKDIIELSEWASIPVINGLSDLLHPCQGLADLYTIKEKRGDLTKVKLTYIGDGNNVLHSLLYGAAKMGVNLSAATPKGYEPDKKVLKAAKDLAKATGANIEVGNDPALAAAATDVLYTDVWASMGKEAEAAKRRRHFKKFQLNSKLAALAKPDCLIMHCLPAHRGEEITDEVIDGPNSVVFDQAENRMHVQKAVLIWLSGKENMV